jgi:hypothetical protein
MAGSGQAGARKGRGGGGERDVVTWGGAYWIRAPLRVRAQVGDGGVDRERRGFRSGQREERDDEEEKVGSLGRVAAMWATKRSGA